MCPTGRVNLASAACLATNSVALVKIAKRSFFTPQNNLMGNWTAPDRRLHLKGGKGRYSPTQNIMLSLASRTILLLTSKIHFLQKKKKGRTSYVVIKLIFLAIRLLYDSNLMMFGL
jgi:hypothetical protein